MKREFKDLIRLEQYECLNREIMKCVNGTFVGIEEYGVASWLGIPYAKPPVGERRFKAPEYVDAGDGVFEAKYYGKNSFGGTGYPDCVQKLQEEAGDGLDPRWSIRRRFGFASLLQRSQPGPGS